MIGQTIAHYRITEKLGEGGMGVVYKAEDTKLDRTVALKFLAAHLLNDEEAKARFLREAKAAAALDHPNICTVYEIGEAEGKTFLSMAFIEGEPLEAPIERGPLPLKDALDIGRQIADGLEAAHEKRVIHRDIKPANVMVDAKGRATIMDFGLARLTEASRLTKTDQTMGTVAYMSPEQAQGMEVDGRSDIWALGVVLYEMVRGQRPFLGEYDQALLYEIVQQEPEPLTGVRAGVPMELEFIVGKCLAKDPANRYQSATDAIVDLRTCAEKLKSGRSAILRTGLATGASSVAGTQVATRTLAGPNRETSKLGTEPLSPPAPAPSKITGRIWMALAVAFLVSTAVFAWLYVTKQPAPPQPITFTIDPPEGVTFESGEYAPPVLSPDGTKLAFVGLSEDGKSLWVRPLDSLDAQRLPGTAGAEFPFWSPDNRYLGFFADGKLKKIDIAGGPPQTLCDAPNGRGGAWAEDDQGSGVIVFSPLITSRLHRVSSAGGESTPVTDVSERRGLGHRHPRFLPGDRFLYIQHEGPGSLESPVFLGDLSSARSETQANETRPLLQASSRVWYAPPSASHPQGYLVYVLDGTLFAQPFDAESAALTGERFPIAEGVYSSRIGGGDFSVSATGTLSYRTGGAQSMTEITWFDRQGDKLGTVGEAGHHLGVRLSPDGGRLAVNTADPQTGNYDIWVRDLRRDAVTRLTFHAAVDRSAVWSPDGTRIAFFSRRDGGGIYERSAGGAGQAEALFDMQFGGQLWDWSRDGRYLSYFTLASSIDVFALPMEAERKPIPLAQTEFLEAAGSFSPDGAWVAYYSIETGRREVYVRPFSEEGKFQVSRNGGRSPMWSADGKEIFYISGNKMMAAPVQTAPVQMATGQAGATFEAGVPRMLFEVDRQLPVIVMFDVTADGQRFIIPVPTEEQASLPITIVTNWQQALVE